VKKAISNNDDNLKDQVEKLKAASMKIGQYMHQNAQQQKSSGAQEENKQNETEGDEQKEKK